MGIFLLVGRAAAPQALLRADDFAPKPFVPFAFGHIPANPAGLRMLEKNSWFDRKKPLVPFRSVGNSPPLHRNFSTSGLPSQKGTSMHLSRFSRRRRQLGAVIAGLCVAAGSVGSIALADSGSGTSVSVEASVFVRAGMSPINAAQAAANLNSAIDSAAHSIAHSAASAIPAGRPVRTTAAATKAFANEVDAALCEFVAKTIAGLKAAGVSNSKLVDGTVDALKQVVLNAPGIVTVTTGAEFAVAGGSDGATVSASVNPVVDTAIRQTISGSVRAIRSVLPLTRLTVRQVAAGVKAIEEASVAAMGQMIQATVDLAKAVVTVSFTTLSAMRSVADSAVAAMKKVLVAVRTALDNLSDVNITAAVDASLKVRAG
jgi:hypothetical protein